MIWLVISIQNMENPGFGKVGSWISLSSKWIILFCFKGVQNILQYVHLLDLCPSSWQTGSGIKCCKFCFKELSINVYMVGEELLHSIRNWVWIPHYSHIKPGAIVPLTSLLEKQRQVDPWISLVRESSKAQVQWKSLSQNKTKETTLWLKRAWKRWPCEIILSSLNLTHQAGF